MRLIVCLGVRVCVRVCECMFAVLCCCCVGLVRVCLLVCVIVCSFDWLVECLVV